jgi:hypothetical protein
MKVATRAGVTSSLEAAITSERTDRRGQRNALHKATTKALHNPAHLSHALQSPTKNNFLVHKPATTFRRAIALALTNSFTKASTPSHTTTMPPIPIHKNAPIKPDGITPSTATQDEPNPPPTRTTPASVPATTTADSSGPPPPQPGARPVPPTAAAQAPYDASTPAPPQPGYTAHHITTETRRAGPPPQFTHPPPTDSALAGRSTTTSTTASKPGPTTLNLGPAASPFQSADTAGPAPTRTSLEHPPGYQQAPDNAPYTAGGGIGGHNGGGQSSESSGEGVGAAAWNVLSKAGEALKKGEEAAWRAVRNK